MNEAIAQIKEKGYTQRFTAGKELLLVGINYDKNKKHSCKIEKVKK